MHFRGAPGAATISTQASVHLFRKTSGFLRHLCATRACSISHDTLSQKGRDDQMQPTRAVGGVPIEATYAMQGPSDRALSEKAKLYEVRVLGIAEICGIVADPRFRKKTSGAKASSFFLRHHHLSPWLRRMPHHPMAPTQVRTTPHKGTHHDSAHGSVHFALQDRPTWGGNHSTRRHLKTISSALLHHSPTHFTGLTPPPQHAQQRLEYEREDGPLCMHSSGRLTTKATRAWWVASIKQHTSFVFFGSCALPFPCRCTWLGLCTYIFETQKKSPSTYSPPTSSLPISLPPVVAWPRPLHR